MSFIFLEESHSESGGLTPKCLGRPNRLEWVEVNKIDDSKMVKVLW